MEFGKSLRSAREAKGYTITQIAEMTHILSAILEGLENEDFSRIAAPIYGRNFVRLYCEAVGLEPKPFVDEFMEILSGNHAPTIKERPVAPADTVPEAQPAAEPAAFETIQETPVDRESATAPEPDLFSKAPEPAVPEPIAPQQTAPEQTAPVSRYASTFRMKESMAVPVLPWRIIVLGVAALVLIVLIVFGIRALYSATTADPAPRAEPAPEASESKPAPAATPAVRTQQQKIPSLYID